MFLVKSPEIIINLNHIKEIGTEGSGSDEATLFVISPGGERTDFCTEDADLVYESLSDIAQSISSGKSVWDWDTYVHG